MGLLSGLKKLGKRVVKGVKKVFSNVGKAIGKIAKSKWGKVLLVAAAVVTGGLAVYGAIAGMSSVGAGATFMTKFVAGAKGFTAALLNPVQAGKGFLAAAQGAGQAAGAAGQVAGAAGTAGQAATAAEAVQAGGALAAGGEAAAVGGTALQGGAGTLTSAAGTTGLTTAGAGTGAGTAAGTAATAGKAAASGGGWLSKAGSAAKAVLKSKAFGEIASGAIKGYAGGQAAEDQRAWEEQQARYYDNKWADPAAQQEFLGTFGQINPGGYTPPPAPQAGVSRQPGSGYDDGGPLTPEQVAAMARAPRY